MLNRKQKQVFIFLLVAAFFNNASARFNSSDLPVPEMSIKKDTSDILSNDAIINDAEIKLHSSMAVFADKYTKDNLQLFEKIKLNKAHHLKSIDDIFKKFGVPVELKYLAIVESKLKTNARSDCGAVGIWQFMPATAKRFDLLITDTYDERENVKKSSLAAARYLKKLYSIYNDWLLVIAAYNSGPAPVFEAIKKSGSRDFWQLQYFLPKETRFHVKKFIATHYYFEGNGSITTMSKKETEDFYQAQQTRTDKEVPLLSEKNEEKPTPAKPVFNNQWVALVTDPRNILLLLKK